MRIKIVYGVTLQDLEQNVNELAKKNCVINIELIKNPTADHKGAYVAVVTYWEGSNEEKQQM